MVLVVEKNKENELTWRCGALQGILKEAHSLFAMFHGPIRTLLHKQPSAELARGHLRTFLTDYLSGFVVVVINMFMSLFLATCNDAICKSFNNIMAFICFVLCSRTDFNVGKKLQFPTYRDSLKERGTVQMLTVSREVALDVQDDTLNLYTYAVLRLTPRALYSNASSWSYLRKGTSVSAGQTSSSSNGTTAGERYRSRSRDTSPGGQNQMNRNFRPLLREKLSKGKDGFVAADFTATEARCAVPSTPILWFQQADECMHLCIYQHKSLTILLLVPASSVINGEEGITHVKKAMLENASQKIVTVEQKLTRGWGGENAYHVSGYRYLLVDPERRVSRASPPGKVTTLAKDSLLALNMLRQEVDLEKSRYKRGDPCHDKDFEVCIRTKNNAWVIAKISQGRELYMALEKGGETLLYASTAVEKFSNRYCEGAFSTD
ncbi:Myrosinase [Zea mays]|uniref:Myrosinase n=1 Tax=Zea mays TaxID=4577 RepID=A0A1D6Q1A1_MAIZE|nr:Myrosinase [Zea mays]